MKKEVIMYPVFEKRFKALIASRQESISSLANKTTFSRSTIGRSLKNGKMNVELLEQIAVALEVSPFDLYCVVCFPSANKLNETMKKLVFEHLDGYFK